MSLESDDISSLKRDFSGGRDMISNDLRDFICDLQERRDVEVDDGIQRNLEIGLVPSDKSRSPIVRMDGLSASCCTER